MIHSRISRAKKRRPERRKRFGALVMFVAIFAVFACTESVSGQGQSGKLLFRLEDEATGEPVISRVLFYRGAEERAIRATPSRSGGQRNRERLMPIRRTVPAGIGIVIDRAIELELPESDYRFRVIRGPEYRIVSGNFTLEKTSEDEKTVPLPRMVDMKSEGWLSGDACVVPSSYSVPLRMAAEDLHVTAVLGDRAAKPIPGREAKEPIGFDPKWIRTDVSTYQGLAFYGLGETDAGRLNASHHSLERLVHLGNSLPDAEEIRIAIEDPFAWELPVWLASGRVHGMFLLGDWLRLDRQVLKTNNGRDEDSFSLREPTQLGRYAERIYRQALDAGLPIVPLAGGGDQSAGTPLGYNRIYAAQPDRESFSSAEAWWIAVWKGQTVVTNGPMLRPLVSGFLPGHTFTASRGETLRLSPELDLAVRDPVEYLEVIHNNQIHYSARLQEFAKAGGVIPPIEARESGWVIIRVMTLHEDHYRAAVSAPWWIEFDGRKRVSKASVDFFRGWLTEYEERLKRLPSNELQRFVPFIVSARSFWSQRSDVAVE
ncbi:MAG: hypothetical protein AAFV88_11500 [Planctomycetota bacterium]